MICRSSELTTYDKVMNALYKNILDSGYVKVKASQRIWIQKRDKCIKLRDPKRCLIDAYKNRTLFLTNQYLKLLQEKFQAYDFFINAVAVKYAKSNILILTNYFKYIFGEMMESYYVMMLNLTPPTGKGYLDYFMFDLSFNNKFKFLKSICHKTISEEG